MSIESKDLTMRWLKKIILLPSITDTAYKSLNLLMGKIHQHNVQISELIDGECYINKACDILYVCPIYNVKNDRQLKESLSSSSVKVFRGSAVKCFLSGFPKRYKARTFARSSFINKMDYVLLSLYNIIAIMEAPYLKYIFTVYPFSENIFGGIRNYISNGKIGYYLLGLDPTHKFNNWQQNRGYFYDISWSGSVGFIPKYGFADIFAVSIGSYLEVAGLIPHDINWKNSVEFHQTPLYKIAKFGDLMNIVGQFEVIGSYSNPHGTYYPQTLKGFFTHGFLIRRTRKTINVTKRLPKTQSGLHQQPIKQEHNYELDAELFSQIQLLAKRGPIRIHRNTHTQRNNNLPRNRKHTIKYI